MKIIATVLLSILAGLCALALSGCGLCRNFDLSGADVISGFYDYVRASK